MTTFGLYLTSQFFQRLLQVRPGLPKPPKELLDYWIRIFTGWCPSCCLPNNV